MKLDVTECNPDLGSLWDMLLLQDGTLLVNNYKDYEYHIIRLSDRGDVIRKLITTDKYITGFILMSNNGCLILHGDGILQRVRIEDGKVLGSRYRVPGVGRLCDGIRIDDDQVLLVDNNKGQIFIYDLKTRNKHVVIDKLRDPTSLDKAVTDQGVFYIVNERKAHTVRVYNDRWMLVRSIGEKGDKDGRLNNLNQPESSLIIQS